MNCERLICHITEALLTKVTPAPPPPPVVHTWIDYIGMGLVGSVAILLMVSIIEPATIPRIIDLLGRRKQ